MDGFNPFTELEKRRAEQKHAQRETLKDLRAFANLKRSESGKRVLRLMKEVCDFDGPVFRTNPLTGLVDTDGAKLRDGFRSAVAFIERNAALAEKVKIGKDADA